MPQLDPTSFPSQLFWLMVSFVALYVLLARFLLPTVQSVIAQRAQTIEGDVEKAESLKSDAARASEQYEESLEQARAKAQAMFLAAQAEISARSAKHQAELDATLEKKLAEADASIKGAKQAVAGKLAPVAGELASLIVELLVHKKPSPQDIGAVISDLAKERGL